METTVPSNQSPTKKNLLMRVQSLGHTIRSLPSTMKALVGWIVHIASFSFLLLSYLAFHLFDKILGSRFFFLPQKQKLRDVNQTVFIKATALSRGKESTINRINLVDLAMRNMVFKRSRAAITVGGMAIGVGSIVFLVSIGFGLQDLVNQRVARLEERRQAEVAVKPGSKERLNDQTLAAVNQFSGVDQSLPVIASVARVNFNNSISDMAVYAVTSEYLTQSAVQPIYGKIFDSNDLTAQVSATGSVAGASTEYQAFQTTFENGQSIEFQVPETSVARVREAASRGSQTLGYASLSPGTYQGSVTWGDVYPEAVEQGLVRNLDGVKQAPWIYAYFALSSQAACNPETETCENTKYALATAGDNNADLVSGYVAHIGLTSALSTLNNSSSTYSNVLGVSDETPSFDALVLGDTIETTTDSAALDQNAGSELIANSTPISSSESGELAGIVVTGDGWVEIASESAVASTEQVEKVTISSKAKREAVVNLAMLRILGIEPQSAVGQTFSTSFVIVGDLLDEQGGRIESLPSEYTIVGVVPDDKTPFFYVPFMDIRSLGVSNFSQLKVVAVNESSLAGVRKQIESLGFSTNSVADTIAQINRLFSMIRLILIVLGMIALSIAALGMFNTLTVSLLERTREVGLMKALGMKSHEVQELFLTESMVMGFFGGILGIVLGLLAGKVLSLLLSAFSLTKGAGFINISSLPTPFVIFVFVLSLIVGIFTGIYPAKRATRISALDALRYE